MKLLLTPLKFWLIRLTAVVVGDHISDLFGAEGALATYTAPFLTPDYILGWFERFTYAYNIAITPIRQLMNVIR